MNNFEELKKNEITKAMTEVEFLPEIPERVKNTPNNIELPWSQVRALGTAFQPIVSTVQSITTGQGGSGIYFVNTHGKTMFSRNDGTGFIGSLKNSEGLVGGGQSTLTQLPCDPTMLCVAAALASIEKKLDEIKEIQEEMLDFIKQKEKSDLRGSLNFLTDVLNNYKFNWNNAMYKNSNHTSVLTIKKESEQKIDFYRELINTIIRKKSLLHSDQDVKKQLSKIEEDFGEYQLAVYLFSFSSFLEVMLLENYEEGYLNAIKNKIETYSLMYRELYTECYNKLEGYSKSSIQSHLLGGLSKVNTAAGKAIEKMPIISKSQLDENLIEAGDKLGKFKSKRTEKTLDSLVDKQNSYVRPFIDNIIMINTMYNQPLEIYFDKENLYIGS